MFHQERVSPQDTHALSFLWWPGGDFSKKPEDHEMFLNLFGARSSPSCSSLSAECEVKRALETWNQSRITESKRRRDVQWYFNPPYASHKGGA